MLWNHALRSVLTALLIYSTIHALGAQGRTGSMGGTVTDQSGAILSGATITVVNLGAGLKMEASSNDQGWFYVPFLVSGEYELSVQAEGFATRTYSPLRVEVDRETLVNPTLLVAGTAQDLSVSAESQMVEAFASSVSGVISSNVIVDLPLNGRDYRQLAVLDSSNSRASPLFFGATLGFGQRLSISGGRSVQNNFRVDGIRLNDATGSVPAGASGLLLGADAIHEFSLLSSTYSAQYGRAAGGVINAVTRSGTNQFHGSGLYFHRNDNLDARNHFDPGEPPEFRRHQSGGSLGGPIAQDRVFFFTNYESLREIRGNTQIDTTLTEDARRGRLQSGAVSVDSDIARLLETYPLPNGDRFSDTGLFIFANDTSTTQHFALGRVDAMLRPRDRLFARYSIDNSRSAWDNAFQVSRNSVVARQQATALEETHVFSTHLMNSFRLGFVRSRLDSGITEAIVPGADDPTLSFLPGHDEIGIVEVAGLTTYPGGTGATDAELTVLNSYQVYDDLSWARGRHTIRVGVSLERMQFNFDSQNRQSGEFRFLSLRDFLTNTPDRFRAQLPGSDTVRGLRQWLAAGYFQDSWHMARNLTLDFGGRYEMITVPTEVNGKLANLDSLYDSSTRVGEPLFRNPSRTNFGPRVGLAWDILGSGKTILRGGYGVYADQLLVNYFSISGVRNPPFFLAGQIRDLSPGDFPKNAYSEMAVKGTPSLRAERFDPNLSQPYVQHWNFQISQQLPFQALLRVAYLGSHGVHLSRIVDDANLVAPTVLPDGRLYFPSNGKRVNPVFSRIRDRSFDGNSTYHALQVGLQRRWASGLHFGASYAWAKSLDDGSTTIAVNEQLNSLGIPVNGYSGFNRGRSDQDIRHRFVGHMLWEVLAGFRTGAIVTLSTGVPTTPVLGYDVARTQTGRSGMEAGQRPNVAPGAPSDPVTGDPNRWFDPAAFTLPEPGYLGNLGRNTLRGPNLANVDWIVAKRFSLSGIRESADLELRAEFFNLLNTSNFELPDAERMIVFAEDGVPGDVGRITSAKSSREIQFGLRVRF